MAARAVSRLSLLLVVVTAAFALSVGYATAKPAPRDRAHSKQRSLVACVHQTTRVMRLVDRQSECRSGERAIVWHAVGRGGKSGQAGRKGKNGKNGRDGRSGGNGRVGKDGVNGKDGKDGVNGKDGANGLSRSFKLTAAGQSLAADSLNVVDSESVVVPEGGGWLVTQYTFLLDSLASFVPESTCGIGIDGVMSASRVDIYHGPGGGGAGSDFDRVFVPAGTHTIDLICDPKTTAGTTVTSAKAVAVLTDR